MGPKLSHSPPLGVDRRKLTPRVSGCTCFCGCEIGVGIAPFRPHEVNPHFAPTFRVVYRAALSVFKKKAKRQVDPEGSGGQGVRGQGRGPRAWVRNVGAKCGCESAHCATSGCSLHCHQAGEGVHWRE